MIEFDDHDSLDGFSIENGELMLGSQTISNLVARCGTPSYVYSKDIMSADVSRLREHLPEGIELHFAIKANPHPDVIEHLSHMVDGLDVASGQELELALKTHTDPLEISFAGPGKQDWELEQALESGIVIIVESPRELDRLLSIADKQGGGAQIALRVNPDFELKRGGMRMSGGAKPFGSDVVLIKDMLTRIGSSNATFVGFHIFSGSQCLDIEAILEAQRQAVELSLDLSQSLDQAPRFFNIGGGFGVPYAPGQVALELTGLREHLETLVAKVKARWPTTKLVLELGRFLVARAGVYVTEVVDVKTSQGQKFVVTDGGMHHHLALSGNFGQAIRRNYPLCVARSKVNAAEETVNIVGPLCTPMDILGDKVKLPALEVGDLIAVFLSGAYGYTASPLKFLSHREPSELVV